MSNQATANARLHHLRSSEISSRARERTATAAPTHSGRRLTYQGGIALDLTGSASHELMPIREFFVSDAGLLTALFSHRTARARMRTHAPEQSFSSAPDCRPSPIHQRSRRLIRVR